MRSRYFIHTVTLKREAKDVQNVYGEFTDAETTIVTDHPARVEFDVTIGGKLQYNMEGFRDAPKILVYFKLGYVPQEMDIVEYEGTVLGRVRNVLPALRGKTTRLSHYELMVEPI